MRRLRLALVLGAAVAAAGWGVLAQPANQTGGDASQTGPGGPPANPPGVPVIQVPIEQETPEPPVNATIKKPKADQAATNAAAAKEAAAKPPPPPPEAPKPVRAPTAVLQALDKVTTETVRFAAPIGQPVRFKNLVFVVKACETTGLGTASPRSSAYVTIDSAPKGPPGAPPPPARQVFKGWMYASTPELNPFQHPIYDAWLITCAAAMPAA